MIDPFAELDQPLPEIKVTCTTTDCDHDLHCFLQKRKVDGAHVIGPCRACGVEPRFDIERLQHRDSADVEHTFACLRQEKIRDHFWSLPFDAEALRKAKKRGRQGVLDRVKPHLKARIGKAANGFDGRQTALSGNVLVYAQHSTATCCRKCLSYWHGIPADHDLDSTEARYCEALVIAYLDERLPPNAFED